MVTTGASIRRWWPDTSHCSLVEARGWVLTPQSQVPPWVLMHLPPRRLLLPAPTGKCRAHQASPTSATSDKEGSTPVSTAPWELLRYVLRRWSTTLRAALLLLIVLLAALVLLVVLLSISRQSLPHLDWLVTAVAGLRWHWATKTKAVEPCWWHWFIVMRRRGRRRRRDGVPRG